MDTLLLQQPCSFYQQLAIPPQCRRCHCSRVASGWTQHVAQQRRHGLIFVSASSQQANGSGMPPGAAPQQAMAPLQLSGVWIKDVEASDLQSYDRALAVMNLSGLQRTTALKLFEGLEITQRGHELILAYLTVVPFYQVKERFSLHMQTTMPRRDMRRGVQTAEPVQSQPGRLLIDVTWPAPYAGQLQEELTCPSPDELHVKSTISVGNQSETTVQVFKRSGRWQPKHRFTPDAFGLKGAFDISKAWDGLK